MKNPGQPITIPYGTNTATFRTGENNTPAQEIFGMYSDVSFSASLLIPHPQGKFRLAKVEISWTSYRGLRRHHVEFTGFVGMIARIGELGENGASLQILKITSEGVTILM